ncbi:hypothetical protein ACFL20_09195 [Spirochaetota bacterium]
MMKIYRKIILNFVPIMSIFLLLMTTGCSYITDAIEGEILNRASFSITATYDDAEQSVLVAWNRESSGGDFAGWEIYISEEPDDEFAGYILVASRYVDDINDDLHIGTTKYYSHDVTYLLSTPGRYFYRVAVIYRDEATDEDKDNYSDDMDGSLSGWDMTDPDVYHDRSHIDSISGFTYADVY